MSTTVVVTGASRGIGKSIAIGLAREDINIVINCLKNREKLADVQKEVIQKGAQCEIFLGDLSD